MLFKIIMKLILHNPDQNPTIVDIFQDVIDKLESPPSKDVELMLVDDTIIRELNLRYRLKDKATDVLSFPIDDENIIGQIVISVETAEEQAKELGQSLEDELQFLFTHGLLHLLGYTHDNEEDEKIMLAETYRILGRKK